MGTDEQRFVIRAPLGMLFFALLLIGLGSAAIYYGFQTFSRMATSPEHAALFPTGVLMFLGSGLLYSSSRPLVLDKKADRVIGYPQELSKAQKVVVTRISTRDDAYVVELVFTDGNFRLSRSGWPYENLPHGPDQLAKQIGAFLGIPVETYAKFYVTLSLSKGLHLTKEQAKDAEKSGIKVDPDAIK